MDDDLNAENNNDNESTDSNEPNELEIAIENDVSISQNENSNDNLRITEENQILPLSQISVFDLDLTASHSYLGSNFEQLRGRTILDAGIYMDLPLLIKHSIVLFPGQTLPMAVFGTNVIDMLTKCIRKNRTFGVVCLQADKLETIGTTAEIYEYIQGNPEEGFCIKAKGRQRFKIIDIEQGHSEISATVKIIPEITLPHPLFEYRLTSLDSQRTRQTHHEQKRIDKLEGFEAIITSWPYWVYRQYDPYRLAIKIREQLKFIENRGSCIPIDPMDLSFWVAQNLPLNDSERIELLKYDCAISRLQWELKYLTKDRVLVCSNCEKQIGKQSNIFLMNKEGPQSTFCNAGGYIYDTVTLSQAENLKLSYGPPTSEYSWFPGYAWKIAMCKGCKSHMGWRYTAEKDKILNPMSFWGLTRGSLKSKKILNIDN